jgi:endogenous inhibitor of DNA gyrase (YacG/DUF329 family)
VAYHYSIPCSLCKVATVSTKNLSFCCRCRLILLGQLAEGDTGGAEVLTGSKQPIAPDFSAEKTFQEHINALSWEERERYYNLERSEFKEGWW